MRLIVVGLVLMLSLSLTMMMQTQVYATGANPKTPEHEIMDADDPNYTVQRLASGGICAVDDNLAAMEEDVGVEMSQPLKDKLKLETMRALNNTVDIANSNTDPGEEPTVLGNPEDC
jgi:hypothetical protein